MNFDQVLELIRTVSASELTSFQYEEGNQKITMQAHGNTMNIVDFDGVKMNAEMQECDMPGRMQVGEKVQMNEHMTGMSNTNIQQNVVVEAVKSAEVSTGNIVNSPLVGRFYVAPAEDAEPFVKVGDTVKKGQVLAIVEAMKLMNEIESDYDGVVTEILADNGEGVEYGQPLFRIS